MEPTWTAVHPLRVDRDVTVARRRAKEAGQAAGLDEPTCARLAAAVSELCRNAVVHGGGGELSFSVVTEKPSKLVASVRDEGPGLADLGPALEKTNGTGGLARAQRLLGSVRVSALDDGGTLAVVSVPITRQAALELVEQLGPDAEGHGAGSPIPATTPTSETASDLRAEARRLREELTRVERELEETNRGVVAVYAELDDTAAQLRSASELKSRFLSNVSHEFRTPLGSIIALSGLLLDSPLDADQARQVRYVAQAARELSALVDDLLDLARVEAGRIPIHQAPFDIADVLRTLRGTLAPLAGSGEVELRIPEPPDLPALVSDQLRFSQIVRNFVSNALKFTEHGSVTVSARLAPADRIPPEGRLSERTPPSGETGEYLVVEVSDTGVGIAPEDLDRIFEEFVQVEGPLQTRVKGTGLGLPLARRLAALLGGAVWVTSRVGEGSTFAVALPVRDVPASAEGGDLDTGDQATPAEAPVVEPEPAVTSDAAAAVDAVTEPERGRPTPAARAPRLIGKVQRPAPTTAPILVADDDEITRYLVADALNGLGHPVRTVGGGIAALAAVRAGTPALIVLDVEMPDLDGVALVRRLRDDPETAAIPIVLHTGRDPGEPRIAEVRDLVQALVPKGGAPETLLDAARKALEGGA
jgi:signal transduction histidine kinase/CheY-like chemotaxis protein